MDERKHQWNVLYRVIETGLREYPEVEISKRAQHEDYVGSSIQFKPRLSPVGIELLILQCEARGVDLKWFGAASPKAFTSRYDSWRYLGEQPILPNTLNVLARTCDMRVPLTFNVEDCRLIASIVGEEVQSAALTHGLKTSAS